MSGIGKPRERQSSSKPDYLAEVDAPEESRRVRDSWYDWRHLFESYEKYVTRASLVVEIGSSQVDRTRELSALCGRLIGVEYFEDRIPADFGNVSYVHGDWQKLSEVIPPDTADIVISSHVIEHVEDDLKAINEVYRILKPGGVAVINTPNRTRLIQSLVALVKGPPVFPYWEHVREYSQDDLETLLRLSDFRGKFRVTPIVFGICNGYLKLYLRGVPRQLARWANYWEIELTK